jgi:hypothetical protein
MESKKPVGQKDTVGTEEKHRGSGQINPNVLTLLELRASGQIRRQLPNRTFEI